MTFEGKVSLIEGTLGPCGRMLSSSKRSPPGHRVFWNANVYDSEGHKLWFGDVDVTASAEKLGYVADAIGTIYVTRETPYRFSHPTVEELNQDSLDDVYVKVVKFNPK